MKRAEPFPLPTLGTHAIVSFAAVLVAGAGALSGDFRLPWCQEDVVVLGPGHPLSVKQSANSFIVSLRPVPESESCVR